MTFLSALYTLVIYPIELLFDTLFTIAYRLIGNNGMAIIVLSLAVNFLVLPLYKRADKLQSEERDIQAEMAPMVKHIKKTFKGDERFFMLQEYYSKYNYKPIYALKSSISLLLQIPFFVAAYNLLSGMQSLQGESFGFISDLGREDAVFMIGAFPVNILPILMTLINIISGIVYTKGHPLKEKIQVYGLATIFLVLLYRSPSGLVFYWLLNNIFSLLKNIIECILKPRLKGHKSSEPLKLEPLGKDMRVIFLSCTVLALLTGLLLPAGIVSLNPAELTNTFIPNPHSPLTYLLKSVLTSVGTFMIWIPVFVYLLKGRHIKIVSYVFVAFASVGMVNALLFNKDLGLLSERLIYERPMIFKPQEIVINLIVDIAIAAVVFLIAFKKTRYIRIIVTILLISSMITCSALGFIAGKNYDTDYMKSARNDIHIPFTTTGQNVVVIMMDRMIGAYIPYIFDEHPEVRSQFDGFTYYPNTISFGTHTNTGSAPLFGGYEYTPDKMNLRSDELLRDKQNEALRVLPVMFSDSGWNVTVCDQPYANYKWLFDASIYDGYEGIDAFSMSLSVNNELSEKAGADMEERLYRNFFCYGLMRTLPYFLQPFIYSEGSYNHIYDDSMQDTQYGVYLRERMVLESLSDFTEITDSPQNCFFVFANQLTHADEVHLLSDEKYDQPPVVNNVPMYLDDEEDYKHYQCNVEACILLGQWFDYLRENGVYDNTRIIIVADHGQGLNNFDDLQVMDLGLDAEWFNPVLMVKDFDQTGFEVSNEFMTNADTPFLAVNGIIDNPVNPFTDMPITYNDKKDDQLIYNSYKFDVNFSNGTKFNDPDGYWLAVNNNIWDDENWSIYEGDPT